MSTFAKRILADLDEDFRSLLSNVFDKTINQRGEVTEFAMDSAPNVKWLVTEERGGVRIQCKRYGFKKLYTFNSFLYRWRQFLKAFGSDVNDLVFRLDMPPQEQSALDSIVERSIDY